MMCRLLVEPNSVIVSIGFIVETNATIIHEKELGSNNVQIEVKDLYIYIYISPKCSIWWDFVSKQGLGTLVSWPKHVVFLHGDEVMYPIGFLESLSLEFIVISQFGS